MYRCELCDRPFEPTQPARTVQRFCSDKCRKAWHYRERERLAYGAKVEAAEERMMNGNANIHGQEKIDLAALGLVAKQDAPVWRRKI